MHKRHKIKAGTTTPRVLERAFNKTVRINIGNASRKLERKNTPTFSAIVIDDMKDGMVAKNTHSMKA
jgi:hypothetical protein